MKIGIVGSRTFNNYNLFEQVINKIVQENDIIVSGGAIGADSLAEMYAKIHKFETIIFKPEWEKYGKQAGFIRNSKIVEESDYIIAFWDGNSKGTLDTISKAENLGKQVIRISV